MEKKFIIGIILIVVILIGSYFVYQIIQNDNTSQIPVEGINDELINTEQEAIDYAKQHKLELPMRIGDMRSLPFEDNYFGYVYSWNTIFHMTKLDIKKGVNEMIRVLKPGGLC